MPRHAGTGGQPPDPALLIMASLAAGPKHGYAITADVASFAGVRLGPGTLYAAITRLEDLGLIEALAPEDRRRPYALTDAGRELLRTQLAALERIASTGLDRLAIR